MNSFTDKLINCKAGCYIDMQCINHLLYADDICLMSPTAIAMVCKKCMATQSYENKLHQTYAYHVLPKTKYIFRNSILNG